jgi:phage baseplate assembly protein W
MAAIRITSLSPTLSSRVLFNDIRLDLETNYTKNTQLLKNREIKDIQNSENIGAIQNSIFNLFTTMPGQKILNPVFGLNLQQFIFTGLSELNGKLMAETILKGLNKYEPRVKVKNVNVEVDYDNNQYNIYLLLNVPALNNRVISLKGTLSESGYYFN